MPNPDTKLISELKALIADFLRKRLDVKLDKIKGSDRAAFAKRQVETGRFDKVNWLISAASRARQIQLVTHLQKATHPDLKITAATSLYVPPRDLAPIDLVGSHVLGDDFHDDASGNAAALDIFDFLTLTSSCGSLLDLARRTDHQLAEALSDDRALALSWMRSFSGIVESPLKRPRSSTLARQVYWPATDRLTPNVSPDPHNDADYHLLAPLYASSLAHHVYLIVKQHRFGEGVKEARQARRDGVYSDQVLHDYPQMAVQKLGGSNAQNISQLNSERRGDNRLLASLPPVWKSAEVTPLLGSASMLRRYERRPEVRQLVKALADFLQTDPARTLETRNHREELANALIDELLQFAAELRSLPPGWSQVPECQLSEAERHWLDPQGVAEAAQASRQPMPSDSAERISRDFANWLNSKLRDPLPVGDAEFIHWRNLLLAEIDSDDWEGRDDE